MLLMISAAIVLHDMRTVPALFGDLLGARCVTTQLETLGMNIGCMSYPQITPCMEVHTRTV